MRVLSVLFLPEEYRSASGVPTVRGLQGNSTLVESTGDQLVVNRVSDLPQKPVVGLMKVRFTLQQPGDSRTEAVTAPVHTCA